MMQYRMVHTCIRVKDLEKSLKFYETAFGMKERARKDHTDDGFVIVFIKNDLSPTEIELTYNIGHEPYQLGDGFSHIGVKVADLQKSRDFHRELGLDVSELMGLPGSPPRFYFVTDPDGYEIEVIQE